MLRTTNRDEAFNECAKLNNNYKDVRNYIVERSVENND